MKRHVEFETTVTLRVRVVATVYLFGVSSDRDEPPEETEVEVEGMTVLGHEDEGDVAKYLTDEEMDLVVEEAIENAEMAS